MARNEVLLLPPSFVFLAVPMRIAYQKGMKAMIITSENLVEFVLPGDLLAASEILDEMKRVSASMTKHQRQEDFKLAAMYSDMLDRLNREISSLLQAKEQDDKARLIRDLQHEIKRLSIDNQNLTTQVFMMIGVRSI